MKPFEPCAAWAPAMPGPRGVGFACHLSLPRALYTRELLDFVEITPEVFHREERAAGGRAARRRIQLVPDRRSLDEARRLCDGLPAAMHGVSLSIGSAHGMNEASLAMMDRLQRDWPFFCYSEHLHFQVAQDAKGRLRQTGVPFPLPPTREAVALVAGRASLLQRRYGVPFLLENPAHYLSDLPSDPDVGDEFGLMAGILEASGCWQLLDLHNLHCNAINLGFSALAALDRVRLDRVGEIHLAGGSWRDGFYTDAHDGAVPELVWELLEETLARAPWIGRVVFEILDVHLAQLGPDGIARQLQRARCALERVVRPLAQAA
jgi:hypothetical protein